MSDHRWLNIFYFFWFRADAHKQQQQQQEESGKSNLAVKNAATVLADQDQRKVLKFGFSSKLGASKVLTIFFWKEFSCLSFS